MIRDSLDPGSVTAYWRIATPAGATIGLVGLKAPMAAMLALRAIGWRSLELLVALDPRHWGSGLATEAIAAVAAHSAADGVTFAIVAGVDAPNARSHKLMGRCGFQELGRIPGPAHPIVVYEKAL
jgi:RimJ/RimL family protein N-acetyltransferase